MSDFNSVLKNVPELSFIGDKSLEDVKGELFSDFHAYYKEITGESKDLAQADPIRLILNAVALQIYQALVYVDRSGKQDLLKYSYGKFLDNLAALRGVTRLQPTAAETTVRFTLSAARLTVSAIPAGTRVTDGSGAYYKTKAYAEIPISGLYADAEAICTETGEAGNGKAVGQLTTLVDPLPYVCSVSNTVVSSGGTDTETDADLAERAYLAPSSYSVAGPADAYEYWARVYNSDIGDVRVVSPAAGSVVVYFLMDDGTAPTPTVISGLQSYLADEDIRPLTDNVTASAPTDVQYDLTMTYYINRSASGQAATIQDTVSAAAEDYISWQRKIGRDINPSELIKRVQQAGAKRVTVTAPVHTAITETQVSSLGTKTVTYGGLEDD